MNARTFLLTALTVFAGLQARADNFVTITPTAISAATVATRWTIGSNLSGLDYVDGSNFPGATATNFFTITGESIPASGGDPIGFTSYLPDGTASAQALVDDSLTPSSYSGLTYVAQNLSLIGPLSFYAIHHRTTGDYLALIQMSTPTVSDQKPMSGPGNSVTAGATGYFALTFAADNPNAGAGWNAGDFYYLRTDPISGHIWFGSMIPALLSGPTDRWDLGLASLRGYTDLAYTSTNVGFGIGASKFYYLRLDPITHTTFFGWIDPLTGTATDIQNLGGVYRTLTFTTTDVGYGANNFYSIGQPAQAQTITFGAIASHTACDSAFTLNPSASSGLPVTLAVTSGPATVSGDTVTLTGEGNVTLQATQAGNSSYLSATPVSQTFAVTACTVAPVAQTITFAAIPGHTACDSAFTLSPTASSGLPVTLVVVSGPAAVSGATVTLTGEGNVTLQATQAGNSSYLSATPISQTFAVNACPVVPLITSLYDVEPWDANPANIPAGVNIQAGTVGVPFTYQITATGSPTSYSAVLLPPGLSLDPNTGAITGTPTAANTWFTTISASNAAGSDSVTVIIVIGPAGAPPMITSLYDVEPWDLNPANIAVGANIQTGTVGVPFGYQITATGSPTSYSAVLLPPGLSLNPSTGAITGTPTAANTWFTMISASNAAGTGTAVQVIIVIVPATVPVSIIAQPTSQTVAPGGQVTFSATAAGVPTPSYQWYLNGVLIPGATGATLTIANVQPANAGAYTLAITNAGGTLTTAAAILTVPFSRIMDISALAQAGTGSQALTLGFVVSGNNKTLLVRGIGPALLSFGVANPLTNPQLTLFSGSNAIATDAGWQAGGNGAAISALTAQVGAFSLANASKDSALIDVANAGAYAAQVVNATNTTGTALAEIYDADTNLGARLVNASARMQVNLSGGSLSPVTIGFVIGGNTTKTVLIRGIGPTLSAFGVAGVLANPQITVFSGTTPVASNAGWGNGNNVAQMSATFAQVGAFALPAGSLDAALLSTLQPGSYTVQVIGVGNTVGVALLEIYDVQ